MSKKSRGSSKQRAKTKARAAKNRPAGPRAQPARAQKKGSVTRGSTASESRGVRVAAVFSAMLLTILASMSLLAFRDAPNLVQPGYSDRMRIYLGTVAALALLGAGAVGFGASTSSTVVQRLWSSMTEDWRHMTRRIRDVIHRLSVIELTVLATATIIGILLRARYLGQPMRYDEAYTFNFYGRFPLAVSLSAYDSPNNHFLNTLLLHLSTSLFGNHEWAVRLPAFVFGVALVPAVYCVARMFSGTGSALVAAMATAVWPVLVEYSVNARGYSAVAFFSLQPSGSASAF